MNSISVRTTFATATLVLVALYVFETRSVESSSASTSQVAPKPLLLEKNEGERRIWREPPPGDFILKVSPKQWFSAPCYGYRGHHSRGRISNAQAPRAG